MGWGGVEPMVRPAGSPLRRCSPPRVLGRVCLGTRLILLERDSSCSFAKPLVLISFSPLLSSASHPKNAPETRIALESPEHYPDRPLPGLIRVSF